MNANDPILTDYAFNELEPRERAQIEQQLHEHPHADAEVQRIRALGRLLGSTLAKEPAEGLTKSHRAEVLKAASIATPPAESRKVVDGPKWWRTWEFGATAAACMVFGFGAYAIFDALTESRPKYADGSQAHGDRMMIGVPRDDADSRHLRDVPPHPGAPSEPATGVASVSAATKTNPFPGKLTIISPSLDPRVAVPVTDDATSLASNPTVVKLGPPAAIEKTPQGIKRTPGASQPPVEPLASASAGGLPKALPAGNSLTAPFAGAFLETARQPVSLFPISIGTSSYAEVTASLRKNQLPRPESVRIDELINVFNFDYHQPSTGKPLTIDLETGPCPWNGAHRILRVGIRTRIGGTREIVAENIVSSVKFERTLVASYRLVGYEGQGEKGAAPSRKSLIAGETATVLFEFVPATATFRTTDDFATVSLTYTQPGSGIERSVQSGIRDTGSSWSECGDDFRWAASVATFGMLVRSTSVGEPENWKNLLELFRSSSSGTLRSDRTAFLNYVTKASAIATTRRER